MARVNDKTSCEVCGTLGNQLFADFDEGQEFPEACRNLDIALWFHELHDLRRCPLCGTYFDFTYCTDNDIFQPTHTGEYRRISTTEAETLMAEEAARKKKWASDYRRKLRRKHAPALDSLDEDSRRMVDFMLHDWDLSADPDSVAKTLSITPERSREILESLTQKGITYKRADKLKGDWHDNYGLNW